MLMGNLEKSWNFKMVIISRPGKIVEKKCISKVWENVLY